MKQLTKQDNALGLLNRALDDFFKHFMSESEIKLRFNFIELDDFLFNRELGDAYVSSELFITYLHRLYILSLHDLKVQQNKTFDNNFKSLKLMRNLPNLKTKIIQQLFLVLEKEFETK